MFAVSPIPAFKDNYIWLLTVPDGRAAVVDPGDAAPVIARLRADGLRLDAILVTHHHADHQGGVAELLRHWPARVFAPENESITGCSDPLSGGETLDILDTAMQVVAVPGHTLGHLAYVAGDVVFCGDTLFGAGCGRLFEGTPGQMFASLSALAAGPGERRFYCAHEYTEMNLRFARAVEPDNPLIAARQARVATMRAAGEATVPLSLAEERASNPFLRCDVPAVIAAARAHGATGDDPVAVFAALRAWRNTF